MTTVEAAERCPGRPVPAVAKETTFAAPDGASVQDERPRTNVLNRGSRRPSERPHAETRSARPAQSQRHSCRNAGERNGENGNKNPPPPHPALRLRDERIKRKAQARNAQLHSAIIASTRARRQARSSRSSSRCLTPRHVGL